MRTTLLVVLAACGSPHAPRAVDNQAPASKLSKPVPCPPYADLASAVRAAWTGGSAEAKVELCVPLVRDGKPLWWIEGHTPPPPNTMHEIPTRRALVDQRRELVWQGDDPHAGGFGYLYMGASSADDLDGDGNDEVLYERTTGEGGVSGTDLVVVYFEPHPVVMSVSLSWTSDAGAQRCDGSWSTAPGAGRGKRSPSDGPVASARPTNSRRRTSVRARRSSRSEQRRATQRPPDVRDRREADWGQTQGARAPADVVRESALVIARQVQEVLDLRVARLARVGVPLVEVARARNCRPSARRVATTMLERGCRWSTDRPVDLSDSMAAFVEDSRVASGPRLA